MKRFVKSRVVALSVASILVLATAQPSRALPAPLPLPPPAPLAASPAVAAGVIASSVFIGVVGALCIWDLVQKFQGRKSWDGSTPVVVKRKTH
jgi:hypothetical protein